MGRSMDDAFESFAKNPKAKDFNAGNVRIMAWGVSVRNPETDKYESTGAAVSYQTPIAFRLDEHRVAVNFNKYSVSTTRHQSRLLWALEQEGYKCTGEAFDPGHRMGMTPRHHYGWMIYSDDPAVVEAKNPYEQEWERKDKERDNRRAKREAQRALSIAPPS